MTTVPTQLKVVKEHSRKEILLSVARDAQNGRVYFGASDAKVYGFDPAAEKPEFVEFAGHASYVTGVAVAGSRLVSGGYDGRLIWWDVEKREATRTLDAHARWIRRVVASPDGQLVASVADDMVCRVWDAATGEKRLELRGHAEKTPHHFPSMLYACAFSADGARLATADRTGHVVIWDAASGKSLRTLEAPTMYTWDPKQRIHSIGGPRSLAFSPDSRRLAIGGMGQVGNIDHLEGKTRVEVFDWEKAERTHEFPGDQFKGLVEKLAFLPSGDQLIAAGGDSGGSFQLYDLPTGKALIQEKAPSHVHDFCATPTFDAIYAATHGRLVTWSLT